MPELPDVIVYIEALAPRVLHQPLEAFRLGNPFVVRTISPTPAELIGRQITGLERIGKRIVFAFEGDAFIAVHLMIAGRFRWRPRGTVIPRKIGLAAFDFPGGTLLLTEAGSRRQASIQLFKRREALAATDPGGLEPLAADEGSFRDALTRENHTLKRALTDPRLFSGIGNAYSDEILHDARLSPMKLTRSLAQDEIGRLYESTRRVLALWLQRLRDEAGAEFPEKVTAFRDGMAAHGRYGKPCPVCGAPIQRIVYARNEANYCARCQTGGKLLSDRALSRLLKEDWPASLEEMEARKASARAAAEE
jgi:formamidopyrimidine-DNA glycosylase